MKKFVIRICALFLVVGCEPISVEIPPYTPVKIENNSFEINGQPMLKGWRFGNVRLAESFYDAPDTGGVWSLKLSADWIPTSGYAYIPVNNIQDGDVIILSCYIKALGPTGGGSLQLRIGSSLTNSFIKHADCTDTSWTLVSLRDSVALNENDSVWVVLSSFSTEIVPREGLFDFVSLVKENKY